MNTIIDTNQLAYALLMGGAVAGIAGYLGSLMLTKRMALVGGALGHLALPGMTLALMYGFDVSLGALAFLLFGAGMIWLLHKHTTLSQEALTAVVFSSCLAIAFLFLQQEDAPTALLGNLNSITPLNTLISIGACILLFGLIDHTYNKMILINISQDLALVQGISVNTINLVYLLSVALVVALGVRIVGGLMTAALVAIPAAASANISTNISQYRFGSLLIGFLSALLGIMAAVYTNLPVGPLVIIASSLLFVLSFIARNKR